MEAGAVRPRPGDTPSTATVAWSGVKDPVRGVFREAGQLGAFSVRAIAALPGSTRYLSEILRQIGILIAGSALVIWFMTLIIGTMCATEAVYTLRGYGATSYAGSFTFLCGTREMSLYMFAYMLSAKVGCGLVAEIGSMRINDEIDALHATGIDPMRYVVGTRFLAALIAMPLLIIVGLAFTNLGHFIVVVLQLGDVSQGGWELIHWSLQSPSDILLAVTKAFVMGSIIVLVALYYGYTAGGGPIGVGNATARSMVFNLVVVNVTATLMTMLFWGLDAKLPIGG